MFELIRDHVAGLGGRFQIVLTEHADPTAEWYQAAVVERWRDGVKLIPQEWINSLAQSSGPEGPEEPDEGTTSQS